MKTTLAILGLLLLILFECARVYLIMPMPGSQNFDSIEIAYFLGSNKWIIRFIGYLMVSVPLFLILRNGVKKEKLIVGGLTAMYLIVFYVFTFQMEADKKKRDEERQKKEAERILREQEEEKRIK